MSDPRIVAVRYWVAQLQLADLWELQSAVQCMPSKEAIKRAMDEILEGRTG